MLKGINNMSSERIIQKIKEASSLNLESVTRVHQYIQDICQDNNYSRSILIAGAQSLQLCLQKWSSNSGNSGASSGTPLGLLCVGLSKCTFRQLAVSPSSDYSEDDATKALKVLSFVLINALKMTTDVESLLQMCEVSSAYLCHRDSKAAATDIMGKCIAHNMQCIAQLANKFRSNNSTTSTSVDITSLCNRLGNCLKVAIGSVAFEAIDQCTLSSEERSKLLTYVLDATVGFVSSMPIDRTSSDDMRLALLQVSHRYDISLQKILDQINRQIVSLIRTESFEDKSSTAYITTIDCLRSLVNYCAEHLIPHSNSYNNHEIQAWILFYFELNRVPPLFAKTKSSMIDVKGIVDGMWKQLLILSRDKNVDQCSSWRVMFYFCANEYYASLLTSNGSIAMQTSTELMEYWQSIQECADWESLCVDIMRITTHRDIQIDFLLSLVSTFAKFEVSLVLQDRVESKAGQLLGIFLGQLSSVPELFADKAISNRLYMSTTKTVSQVILYLQQAIERIGGDQVTCGSSRFESLILYLVPCCYQAFASMYTKFGVVQKVNLVAIIHNSSQCLLFRSGPSSSVAATNSTMIAICKATEGLVVAMLNNISANSFPTSNPQEMLKYAVDHIISALNLVVSALSKSFSCIERKPEPDILRLSLTALTSVSDVIGAFRTNSVQELQAIKDTLQCDAKFVEAVLKILNAVLFVFNNNELNLEHSAVKDICLNFLTTNPLAQWVVSSALLLPRQESGSDVTRCGLVALIEEHEENFAKNHIWEVEINSGRLDLMLHCARAQFQRDANSYQQLHRRLLAAPTSGLETTKTASLKREADKALKRKVNPNPGPGKNSYNFVHLRGFLLLADYATALSGGDLVASSGGLIMGDVNDIIGESMSALRQVVDSIHKQSKPASSGELFSFLNGNYGHPMLLVINDILKLYHYLGVLGRDVDQASICALLSPLLSTDSSEPVTILNIVTWLKPVSTVLALEAIRLLWANASPKQFDAAVDQCLQCLKMDFSGNISHRWATELHNHTSWMKQVISFLRLSYTYLHQEAVNHHSYDNELRNFEAQANQLIQSMPNAKDNIPVCNGQPRVAELCSTLAGIKNWIFLISAKTIMNYWGQHKKSFANAWHCLSNVCNSPGTLLQTNHSRTLSADAKSEVVRQATLDSVLLRVEVLLLLGEIYEMSGDVGNAVTYISEALALAQLFCSGSNSLKHVVDYHSIRIWLRCGSSRFLLTVNDFVDQATSDSDHSCDAVTRKIRLAVCELAKILGINPEDYTEQGQPIIRDRLSYRYIDKYWAVEALMGLPYVIQDGLPIMSSRIITYNTVIGSMIHGFVSEIRSQCIGTNGELVLKIAINQEPGLAPGAILEDISVRTTSVMETLELLQDSINFEIIRDQRRLLCSLLTVADNSSKPTSQQQAFLCGASSIGVTQECLLSKPGSTMQREIDVIDIASLLQRATLGDQVAIDEIFRTLNRPIAGNFGATDSGKLALCFACIDPITTNLILGRWSESSGGQHALPTIVSLPVGDVMNHLLARWKAVMVKSQTQLQQTSSLSAVDKWTEKAKKQWWKERAEVDEEISSILEELEALLGPWTSVFQLRGQIESQPTELTETFAQLSIDESHAIEGKSKFSADALNSFKIADLKPILQSLGLPQAGKKNELIERILAAQSAATSVLKKDSPIPQSIASTNGRLLEGHSNTKLVLLLDEQLQELAWECMPCLKSVQCSRVPSMAILLELLSKSQGSESTVASVAQPKLALKCSKKVSEVADNCLLVNKSWFVIDPESNLPSTQQTMTTFLDPYKDRWNWSGIVGNIPDMETIRNQFARSDLFIYCGHGAGEIMCGSHKLRRMRCPPASLLWGCSSGRLITQGIHDPHGPALDYLNGGARSLIANLWDVTDKDIDKLSMSCMRMIFDDGRSQESITDGTEPNTISAAVLPKSGSTKSKMTKGTKKGSLSKSDENADISNIEECTGRTLTEALVQSRDCCKMKYAVGSAPVVYGIPVTLHRSAKDC